MPQLTLKDVIDTNNGDEEDVLNLKKICKTWAIIKPRTME